MANHIFNALLEALQEEYGSVTQQQIAKALGVTQGTISNWASGAQPSKANLKKLIDFFRQHHAATLVKPIFEFQAIAPVPSGDSWKFSSDATVVAALKASLDGVPGLYVFYDSAGHAIYLGKTEASLFAEAKQRLKAVPNRSIFVPTKAKASQMGQLARFLSAYEVTIPAAIKNLEVIYASGLRKRPSYQKWWPLQVAPLGPWLTHHSTGRCAMKPRSAGEFRR